MSGMAGYFGKKEGMPILLDCLGRLEYLGCDSAGMGADVKKQLKKDGHQFISETDTKAVAHLPETVLVTWVEAV